MKKLHILPALLIAALIAGISSLGAMAQRPTVSILGDSYSTFEGYVAPDTNLVWYGPSKPSKRTDVTDVRQTWWHRYITENGCKLGRNNSYSGSTISYRGYDAADYKRRSYISRTADLGCPDILFVFGGTNDSWAGVPAGSDKPLSEVTEADLYTFHPAMKTLLADLTRRYPNVDIYVLLNDGLRPEINAAVLACCKEYDVPCIELKGIDKKNGHPSVKGMEQIATQIKHFVMHRKRKARK